MKGLKGKLLKKLKTVKAIEYLKPERILQVNSLDGYFYSSTAKSSSVARTPLMSIQQEPKNQPSENIVPVQEPQMVDVSDLEDQELESDGDWNNKENVFNPEMNSNSPDCRSNGIPRGKNEILEGKKFGVLSSVPLSEIDMSTFRRPDLDSGTLFDPNLLAAFKQVVMEVKALEAERRYRNQQEDEQPPLKSRKIIEETRDPLLEFQERCPPGGSDSVILYTTGLRGIRKTFEDCHRIRSLLENMRLLFFERDISMHSCFKEELWELLEGKIVPPRLFVKGRYIGGADEVLGLHEQGKLKPLMEGIPIDRKDAPWEGCVGIRFILCFNCNGSRRIMPDGDGDAIKCLECNENGIIVCPFCC